MYGKKTTEAWSPKRNLSSVTEQVCQARRSAFHQWWGSKVTPSNLWRTRGQELSGALSGGWGRGIWQGLAFVFYPLHILDMSPEPRSLLSFVQKHLKIKHGSSEVSCVGSSYPWPQNGNPGKSCLHGIPQGRRHPLSLDYPGLWMWWCPPLHHLPEDPACLPEPELIRHV